MPVQYKQKCFRCKKNYVTASYRNKYVMCHECQKGELQGEIKDPEMKKFFDIPEEFYEKNSFLRDIKANYLRYENLSERQIEAFKETVEKMKEAKKKESKDKK